MKEAEIKTSEGQTDTITLYLPDGKILVAIAYREGNYPAINIYLQENSNSEKELVCFAEYNPDKRTGQELCVGTYCSETDETEYYAPYYSDGKDWSDRHA